VPEIAYLICLVIDWVGTLTGLFAFVHALLHRAEAFTAADRKTKPIWLAITGGSTAVMVLFGFYGPGSFFWLAAIVAVLVYIVDVRPKLTQVRGSGSGW
jgi:hypothetical protein